MSILEIFSIVYIVIGFILETIAMILHRKMAGTWSFGYYNEPFEIKFFSGVCAWPFIFPKVTNDYIKWRRGEEIII